MYFTELCKCLEKLVYKSSEKFKQFSGDWLIVIYNINVLSTSEISLKEFVEFSPNFLEISCS